MKRGEGFWSFGLHRQFGFESDDKICAGLEGLTCWHTMTYSIKSEQLNAKLRRRRWRSGRWEQEVYAPDILILIFKTGVDGIGRIIGLYAIHFGRGGVNRRCCAV